MIIIIEANNILYISNIIYKYLIDIIVYFRLYETLLAVALLAWSSLGKEMTEIEALGAQPTHCTYEYAYDMYGAHCASRRLGKIPKLRSGIEVDLISNYFLWCTVPCLVIIDRCTISIHCHFWGPESKWRRVKGRYIMELTIPQWRRKHISTYPVNKQIATTYFLYRDNFQVITFFNTSRIFIL